MPTFCATAPAISEEQERKELEELSEEDRWALECDLKGTEHQSSRSPVGPLTPDALHFLQEALESIPKDEKADYLLAMEHNCDLVEQESPAAAFLRRSKMDPWQAARQMVDYWRIRRMLFGELALLPMTIEGALQLDAETLAQEYIVVFEDAHGRPAFYFDRVRVPVGSKMRDSVLRCLFYHYQHMAKSAKTGIVAVYNWRNYDIYKHYDRILLKRQISIEACMPAKAEAVHICLGYSLSVVKLVLPFLKTIIGKRLRQRMVFHQGSDQEVVDSVREYGIDIEEFYRGRARSNNRGN